MDALVYKKRRLALTQHMGQGVAIIPSHKEVARNADTHYPYRFDSDFYYLTGFSEPDAVLVLIAGAQPQSILFCRDKVPEREIWEGFHYGPMAAQAAFGFDAAYTLDSLDAQLPDLLSNQPCVHYAIGVNMAWDRRILSALNKVRGKARAGIQAPDSTKDIRQPLHEMRLIKDAHEIALMQQAANISAVAHQKVMQAAQVGLYEYTLEAEFAYHCTRAGARALAYPSIVASGANACVLHYVANNAPLRDGDLLLIDAGCEWQGYASDITRTFPVNGRFSVVQKAVYEVVLAAQLAAIDAVKVGQHWNQPHEAALKVLAQGLIDLGICHGSVDGVIESEAYKPYYMHRTGHWLGLDVHDVGAYKQAGQWRSLQQGMVLTVEPGLYLRPSDAVPVEFHHIGIRIEDDVLVQARGAHILTAAVPKTVAEIESTMQL